MIIEFLLIINTLTCSCEDKQQAIDKSLSFASKKLKEKQENISYEIEEDENEVNYVILYSSTNTEKGGQLLVKISKSECKIVSYLRLK
jgi:hypothetical protein